MPLLKPTRGIQLNKSHPLARGIIGYWSFNEGTGVIVCDLSGNGKYGTFDATDTPSWRAGKFGSAVSLAGGGDRISLGHDIVEGHSQLTVIIWAKSNVASRATQERLLSNFGGGTDTIEVIRSGHIPARTYFKIITGAGSVSARGTNIADTDWHQWAGVYNGANVTLFIDTVSGTPAAQTGTTEISTNVLGVGYGVDSWVGLIDHIIIYNRALSIFDLTRLFKNPYRMLVRDDIARTFSIVAPGFVEIAGDLAAVSALTDVAPLKRARGIAGGVAALSGLTDVAALKRARGIAGDVTAQSSLAGSIKVSRKISGVIAATSSLSGALSLVGEVSRGRGSGFKPIEGAERLRGLRRSAFY